MYYGNMIKAEHTSGQSVNWGKSSIFDYPGASSKVSFPLIVMLVYIVVWHMTGDRDNLMYPERHDLRNSWQSMPKFILILLFKLLARSSLSYLLLFQDGTTDGFLAGLSLILYILYVQESI